MSKELKDKTVISVNPASVSQPTEEKLKEKEASSVPSTTKTKTTKNESTQSRSDEKKEKVKEGEEEDDEKHMRDVRIAVAGNVDSGKSTLIGVLTGGVLDDGRGLARSKVFVHAHESANGRTSCISQHIMGFNTEGKPVHQPVAASATPAQKTKSWKEVVTNSHSLRTFIDLAGHERYLKTTIAGLTGCFPDHAMIIINSLAGVTKMTREHLDVVLALRIPLFCVVTKIDLCPPNVLKRTKKQLFKILRTPGVATKRVPIVIRSQDDLDTVFTTQSSKMVPVFWVSCVTGQNLPLLVDYISRVSPTKSWRKHDPDPVEFDIDETFNVTGVGAVISGTVTAGVLKQNSQLLLGPFGDSSFIPVLIRSVHCKRVAVTECRAGDTCAVSLRSLKKKRPLVRSDIRRGMVLVDPTDAPKPVRSFEADVMVLHHPTTIKLQYQAVIHCGVVRQAACISGISKPCLRTGDKARVRFRFLLRPEFLHERTRFVFREGNTKGIGWVRKLLRGTDAEVDAMPLEDYNTEAKEAKELRRSEKLAEKKIAAEQEKLAREALKLQNETSEVSLNNDDTTTCTLNSNSKDTLLLSGTVDVKDQKS